MHKEILTETQINLLPLIKNFSLDFGLVGGTSIALYLGHRRSIDFDLFSPKPIDILNIRSIILKDEKIEHTFVQRENEFTVLVNQVKITFLYFSYKLKFDKNFEDIINLPSLSILSGMKAFALGRRSKWKDYVDLYFIIKELGLSTVIEEANRLFGNEFNEKLFRIQLSYFKDIDYSEEVEFMKGFDTERENIKQFLLEKSIE